MTTRITKYLTNYISPKLILLMDIALSFVTSLATILLLNFFSESFYYFYHEAFAFVWVITATLLTLIIGLISGCYKIAIRHTTPRDNVRIITSVAIITLLTALITYIVCGEKEHLTGFYAATLCDFLFTAALLLGARMVMYLIYDVLKAKVKEASDRSNILIYGTGDKSVAIITRLSASDHFKVCGFITPDRSETVSVISELPVYRYNDLFSFRSYIQTHNIKGILFAHDRDLMAVQDTILPLCSELSLQALIAPSIDEVSHTAPNTANKIRQVRIEDLLGRDEIKINLEEIKAYFSGKVVMVTGAAGSIGSELCRQLATFGIRHLVMFDDAETPTHNLRLELEEKFPDLRFTPMIGDVRHKKRLDGAFRRFHPNVVFHSAAYKHVPLMEENPCEAVMVNVYGSRNVADKCVEYGVDMMVMISTDKAVNPTNIMGCSKRLAEIYVQTLGRRIMGTVTAVQSEASGHSDCTRDSAVQHQTKFVTTRFGNVLGSNGSVIPRFRDQIEKGGPVTVTHPDITRFFMTIPEACRLVMEAATLSDGNQIFVFDMGESVKIVDLAKRMIQLAGLELGRDIQIKYTGLRPGEKLYEEVLSNKENTIPTSHDRIRVAKVREYEYAEIDEVISRLHTLADQVEIDSMVTLMKQTVPEFISKNSPFEKLDAR